VVSHLGNPKAMRKNSAAYIEMLFEKRNKAYGAYDLRVNYENRLIKSFGMALLIGGFFFLIPYVLTKILKEKKVEDGVVTICNLDPNVFVEKPKPLSSPSTPKQKIIARDSYRVVEQDPVEKKVIEDPAVPGDPVADDPAGPSSENKMIGGNLSGDADSTDSEIYNIAGVDVVPSFPGGEDAMLKYLLHYLHYPGLARENNVSGRVYVSFIIDEKGKVTEIKIVRGLGYGTEEEVARVIGMMPDWSPGKYQGRNVKTSFVMPVFFSLK